MTEQVFNDCLPSLTDLISELSRIKSLLGNLDTKWIDVRLRIHPDVGWDLLWGDPQFDTDHRGCWSYSSVGTSSAVAEVAKDMLEAVKDEFYTNDYSEV